MPRIGTSRGRSKKPIFGLLVDADGTRYQVTLLNPAFLHEQGIPVPDWLVQAFPGRGDAAMMESVPLHAPPANVSA